VRQGPKTNEPIETRKTPSWLADVGLGHDRQEPRPFEGPPNYLDYLLIVLVRVLAGKPKNNDTACGG